MARGEDTRGKVAEQLTGVNSIEIKATIPHKQIDFALKHFKLKVEGNLQRFIYFFDTPALELYKSGIIMRARRTVGGEHDCTVKFRPVKAEEIEPKWKKLPGFKIETDASEADMTKSASFTMPVEKGIIKRVATAELPAAKMFGRAQKEFIASKAKQLPDLAALQVFGPLLSHRWRVPDPACPYPVTIELWKRDDGAMMMETSIRCPVPTAAFAIGGFMTYLAEIGAEQDTEQQAKTRWALQHYAAKMQPVKAA